MSVFSKLWWVVAVKLLLLPALGWADPVLALGQGSGAPRSTVTIPLSFDPGGRLIAGMQWTFVFPASQIASVAVMPGAAAVAANKTVACAGGAGVYTCLLTGLNTNLVPAGVVANASFTIAAGASAPAIGVQVAGGLAATPDGFGAGVAGIAGNIGVSAPAAVSLAGLSCAPPTLSAGGSATCTLTLTGTAAAATSFSVTSDNGAISVPASVTVAAGASSTTFTASASATASSGSANITVSSGTTSISTSVGIQSLPVVYGGLTFSPASISFSTSGSMSQVLNVTSGANGLVFTATPSAAWIRLNVASGAVNATSITVSADASNLSPGFYSGVISFTTTGAGSYTGTVPVTLTVGSGGSGGGLTASVGALTFSVAAGASQSQSIQVTSSTPVAFTATVSANWLSVSPGSATTSANVTVTVNAGGLAPGSYQGSVTLTPSSGTAVTVTVSLTVTSAPTGPSLGVSPGTLSFACDAGGAAPPSQTVSLASGGFVSYSVTVTGASWLTVNPMSGTAPSTLTVTVDPSNLTAGTYSGTITVTPTGGTGQNIAVSVVVSAPLPTITSIANAASLKEGPLAPGEMVVLMGNSIGPAALQTLTVDQSTGLVSNAVANAQVLFNGVAAPLVYVSATQAAAIVPYQVAGQTSANVQVKFAGVGSNVMKMAVADTAPGIFTRDASGTGAAAMLNQDGSLNGPDNPADKGSVVVVYATGEGETTPDGVTGQITAGGSAYAPLLPVTATVDGQPAEVVWAGEAPGLVAGVMQVNVRIPDAARSGDLALVLTQGSGASQPGVTVSVR